MATLPCFNIVSIQKANLVYATLTHERYYRNIRLDNIEEKARVFDKMHPCIVDYIISHIPKEIADRINHTWKLVEATSKDLLYPIYILKTIKGGKKGVVLIFTTKGVLIKYYGGMFMTPFYNQNDQLEAELLGLRCYF